LIGFLSKSKLKPILINFHLVVRIEADLEYFLGRVSGGGLRVLEVRRSTQSTLFF
jgi:hypothetical protein